MKVLKSALLLPVALILLSSAAQADCKFTKKGRSGTLSCTGTAKISCSKTTLKVNGKKVGTCPLNSLTVKGSKKADKLTLSGKLAKKISVKGAAGNDTIDISKLALVTGALGASAVTKHNWTVHGGPGNDHIIGSNGDDLLDGDAGDDTINGGNGSDEIDGGEGNDSLDGGAGDDDLNGEDGDDSLSGDDGDDSCDGGDGDDALEGGDGNDYFNGGGGSDDIGAEPDESYENDDGDSYHEDDSGDGFDEEDPGFEDELPSDDVPVDEPLPDEDPLPDDSF